MDALRNDLKNIQGGLKELLSKVGPIEVPSWRFPEKTATSVNLEEVLKGVGPTGGDSSSKVLVLELLVDRLLLLLQCCMRLSEQSHGHRSAGLPLTLGSTAKKFSKRMLQDSSTVQNLHNELSSKSEALVSLQSTVHKLYEENKLLQEKEALNPQPNKPAMTNADPTISRPSTSSSYVVPYEAMGTLRINTLSSAGASRSMDNFKPSTAQNPLNSNPVGYSQVSPLSIEQIQQCIKPKCSHVSTQTTVTAFALCAKCSESHSILVNAANSLVSVVSKHGQKSIMSSTDWSAMAEVGGLELEGWMKAFDSDLGSLDAFCEKQEERISKLAGERDLLRETVGKLESESQSLGTQIESLQVSIEEIKLTNRSSLAKNNQVFSDKLKQLQLTNANLEARHQKTKDQLNSAQRQEANFKSLAAELEHRHGQLQNDLQAALHREMQLMSSKDSLEKELSCSKVELESCRDLLDSNKLELSKTVVFNQTLEKRNKSLQTKQLNLLSRLDELDQECTSLGEELRDVKGSRDQLMGEVEKIRKECVVLKNQLEEQEGKLSESTQEQDHLMKVISGLEGELEGVKKQVEDEKHNCRLLMDYPFVKQTSEDYKSHVLRLASSDSLSQKQISSNTIRILLLEEQNSDLRKSIVGRAQETKKNTGKTVQLKQPVQMWKSGLLRGLNEEQTLARVASASSRVGYSYEHMQARNTHQPDIQSVHHSDVPSRPKAAQHARSIQSASELSGRQSHTTKRSHWNEPRKSAERLKSKRTSSSSQTNPPSRPSSSSSSSTKLKGRLGDLVSAIAEAHRASNSSLSTTLLRDDRKVVRVPQAGEQQLAWTEGTWSSSSLDLGDVYICESCDRMYHDRGELEKHSRLCQI